MIIESNVLKADEGMMLTNGETFGQTVYLGKNDVVDNWHEITEKEAERLQNEDVPANSEPDYKTLLDIVTGGDGE